MNGIRQHLPGMRPTSIVLVAALIAISLQFGSPRASAATNPAATFECPEVDMAELKSRIDYYEALVRDVSPTRRLKTVENYHFNSDVRNLERGQTTTHAGGDLVYILKIFPNHVGALDALARLAVKERTERPLGLKHPVRCYLEHAVLFKPDDAKARVIYGIHLAKFGHDDKAIENLEAAEKTEPDNANVVYNLGLLYFDKKDYQRSLAYAKRAYALGFPLPGLKNKLIRAGVWKN